jgi:hypothetical protein
MATTGQTLRGNVAHAVAAAEAAGMLLILLHGQKAPHGA